MLNLYIREIEDYFLRENFRKTKDFVSLQPILNGDFRFFEISITGNATNFLFAHNFTFTPKDVIQTYLTFSAGAGALAWNYSLFSSTFLNLTTSGMAANDVCVVRSLVGRFT